MKDDKQMSKDRKRSLIERLNSGPTICAEGFLFEIERRGYMSSGEFIPMVSLEHPEVLENLHRDFQHAGSDIVQAFTYNGHREKMRVIGKEELLVVMPKEDRLVRDLQMYLKADKYIRQHIAINQ